MNKKKIVAIATARSKKHLKKILKPKKSKLRSKKAAPFNEELLKKGQDFHDQILKNQFPPSLQKELQMQAGEKQITPVPYEEDITITISKERAQRISHRFSDILCWSEGFKAGIRSMDEYSSNLNSFNNGIVAIRDIQDLLKMKL